MSVAVAGDLRGSMLRRVLTAQSIVAFSWVAAMRGGGRFDVKHMVGVAVPLYVAWVGGTVIGVLVGGGIGDPEKLGLDAAFPAFFLALLLDSPAMSTRRGVAAALIGGVVAIALVPFTPAGVPIVAACLGALVGLPRGATPIEPAVPAGDTA